MWAQYPSFPREREAFLGAHFNRINRGCLEVCFYTPYPSCSDSNLSSYKRRILGNTFPPPLSPAPSIITKPRPSFYDDNHHQRHHLCLVLGTSAWLRMPATNNVTNNYFFRMLLFYHQGKCHFCKIINSVQLILSTSSRSSHSRAVSCKYFPKVFPESLCSK